MTRDLLGPRAGRRKRRLSVIWYALTVSIFGGTAESIALSFKSIGHESWFYYYLTACIHYLTACIAVSLVVYPFIECTVAVMAAV